MTWWCLSSPLPKLAASPSHHSQGPSLATEYPPSQPLENAQGCLIGHPHVIVAETGQEVDWAVVLSARRRMGNCCLCAAHGLWLTTNKPIHQTPSAPANSKAAFLRRVSDMKIEGWPLVNCHLGSCYYDDSRWSLTHPRQLSSLCLRRDAELDNRWLCWQCNMPVEGAAANDTAKTSFKSPVEQCYHWWQMHAGETRWDWVYEGLDLNVTLPEVIYALGINIDEVPFPSRNCFGRW